MKKISSKSNNTLAGLRESRYKQGTVILHLGLGVTTIKNTVFNWLPHAEIEKAMQKSNGFLRCRHTGKEMPCRGNI